MLRSAYLVAIPVVLGLYPWFCASAQADGLQFVEETSTHFPQPNPMEYTNQLTIGDLDGDGSVGVADLLILLGNSGPCTDCKDCPTDIDGDCTVGVVDLLILLANWG